MVKQLSINPDDASVWQMRKITLGQNNQHFPNLIVYAMTQWASSCGDK